MKGQDRISALLTKLHAASPAGFAIALHVRYTSPRYLFQSYAKEWLDTYSREGLVLHDPVVRWGFTHEGTIRWNALDDPARVMDRAAAHGLRYGAVVAFVHDGSRTMAGFAIALHVRFTAPKYLFQSYEKEWLDTYSREGLVLHDPVVSWGFQNEGTIRWSDLEDPAGIIPRSRKYGMSYGAVIALVRDGSRSMGGFARADREMTDEEIGALQTHLVTLHDLTARVEALSPVVHNTLKQMSIYLTHG